MRFEIYTSSDKKARWRLIASNGKIVADGGEGYNGTGNARRAIKAFCRQINTATVSVLKPITEKDHDTE